MSWRSVTLIALLTCAGQLAAQPGDTARYALHAKLYAQESEKPLAGGLIKVTHDNGQVDSLYTDTMGVARTYLGLDTLFLPWGLDYNIQVQWPAGVDVIRDQIAMDALNGSTTFLKEYFIRVCTHGTEKRWLPPSVYFLKDSFEPRTDSAWYQQEAQVNSIEDAVAAVVEMLQDNPTMIVNVIGYCDVREKDCESLAWGRAMFVRYLLEVEGIAPERLQAEGRVQSQPYTKAEIANTKDRNERERALARQRHVGYLVASFDYKP